MDIRIRNLICAGTLAVAVASAGVPAFAGTASRISELFRPSAKALSAEPGLHVEEENGYVYGKGLQCYTVSLDDGDGYEALRLILPEGFECEAVDPGEWETEGGDGAGLRIADGSGEVLCELDASGGETEVDAEDWEVIYVTAGDGSLITGIGSFSLSGSLDMTVSETGDPSARFAPEDDNGPACFTAECMEGDEAVLSESVYTGRDYFFTGGFEAEAPGYVFFGSEGTVSLSGMEAWGAAEGFTEATAEIDFDTPVEVTGVALPDISGADVAVTAETSDGGEVAVKEGFSGLEDVVALKIGISGVTEAGFYACKAQTCLSGGDGYPIYGFATGCETKMEAHLEACGCGPGEGGDEGGNDGSGEGGGAEGSGSAGSEDAEDGSAEGEDAEGGSAEGKDADGNAEDAEEGEASGFESVTLPGFSQAGDMSVTIKNTYSEGAQVAFSGKLTVKYGAEGSVKTKRSGLEGGSITFVQCLHEETIVDAGYEATCTEAGLTDGLSCALCGEVLAEGAEIAALGHDYYLALDEPASCTEPGLRVYRCSRCGSEHEEETPATGHSYSERTVEATCMEGGYVLHTCSWCGSQYKDGETGALGHEWNSVRTEPSCTEDGSVLYTCSRCGESRTEALEAQGHDYADTTVAPTCTEDGYTVHVCTRCGSSYTDGEKPAAGHSWTEKTEEPTCTSAGSVTYTCSECGESHVEAVARLGHDYAASVTQPTCTESGYTTHTCRRCGYSYNDDATKALGHDYSTVVTAPTYTSGGYTTYTCTRCGYSYTGNYTDALPPVIVVPDTGSSESSSGSPGSSSGSGTGADGQEAGGSAEGASSGSASSGSSAEGASGSLSEGQSSASSGSGTEEASGGSSESGSAGSSFESGSTGGSSGSGASESPSGSGASGGTSGEASEKVSSAGASEATALVLEASSGSASVSGLVSSGTGQASSGTSVVTWERQGDGSMLLSNGDFVSSEGIVTTAEGAVLRGSDAEQYLTGLVGGQASSWLLRNSEDSTASVTTVASTSATGSLKGSSSGGTSILALSESVVGVSDDGTVYLEGGTEVTGDGTVVLLDGTVLEGEEAEDYLTDTFGEEAAGLLKPDNSTSLQDEEDAEEPSGDVEAQENEDTEETEEKIPFYKNLTFWVIVAAAVIGALIVRRHWRKSRA